MTAPVRLLDLDPSKVPEALRAETYFDFRAHPFAHRALFERKGVNSVVAAVYAIEKYAREWASEWIARARRERGPALREVTAPPEGATALGEFAALVEEGAVFRPAHIRGALPGRERPHTLYVGKGTVLYGATIHLNEGDIVIGEDNVVEPGVTIKGPTILGSGNEIRGGAYFRGSLVVGNRTVLRGELKNVVLMDRANFPHPGYVGDSICGYRTHFGNQATAANLGIFEGLRSDAERKPIVLQIDGVSYDIGKPKLGIILGDESQIGCNSVADPGTFVRPRTIAYSLTRLTKGFYGPDEILKNKPLEKGVIERAPLRS